MSKEPKLLPARKGELVVLQDNWQESTGIGAGLQRIQRFRLALVGSATRAGLVKTVQTSPGAKAVALKNIFYPTVMTLGPLAKDEALRAAFDASGADGVHLGKTGEEARNRINGIIRRIHNEN